MTIETFNTVGCRFDNGGKLYTYKTMDYLVKGDKVVVEVNGVLKVVTVAAVHPSPMARPGDTFYKWIVSKVDTRGYEMIKQHDKKSVVVKVTQATQQMVDNMATAILDKAIAKADSQVTRYSGYSTEEDNAH